MAYPEFDVMKEDTMQWIMVHFNFPVKGEFLLYYDACKNGVCGCVLAGAQ